MEVVMGITESTAVQALAVEAGSWFEVGTRGDTGRDEDRFTRLKQDAPDWIVDLVHDAHGEMFPDDWKYKCIAAALDFIGERDEPEDYGSDFAGEYVDVYTSARIAWLASHAYRIGYVDDAIEQFDAGEQSQDIVSMIGLGQYAEAYEVYNAVVSFLVARLDEVV